MINNDQKNVSLLKAFGDENRLEILQMLKTGEKCACKLLEQLKINQSTLSHHMKLLCSTEIVKSRREGKWTHYSLNKDTIENILKFLNNLMSNGAYL